jgi:hypothetical protein
MSRLILFSTLTFLAVLSGCRNPYYLESRVNLQVSPCGKSETGVNVRIRNLGKITFSKFVLRNRGKDIVFSGLKTGELSCYENISSIWTNNQYSVMITKKRSTITLQMIGIDHVGETEIKHGNIIVDVVVTKTGNRFHSSTHWNIETN